MMKYILAHWRGEQSLLRSCLVNGVVIGAVVYIVLMVAVIPLVTAYVHWKGADLSGVLIYVSYPVRSLWLVCGIWAAVGIFRCGWRSMAKSYALRHRIGGAAAMAAAVVLVVWMGRFCVAVVEMERFLGNQRACDEYPTSSSCEAYHREMQANLDDLKADLAAKAARCARAADPVKCEAAIEKFQASMDKARQLDIGQRNREQAGTH